MDALKLLVAFLRDMSLGILCFLAAALLLLAWPLAKLADCAVALYRKMKGGRDDRVHCG